MDLYKEKMSDKNRQPKAAILTWCYNNGKTNYGQILQCYAMQITVQRLGYDTKVIRYRKRDKDDWPDENYKSQLTTDLYELWNRLEKVENQIDLRILRFIEFIRNNIHLSNQCYTKEQIEEECKDCEVLFCGSDQIWNPIWFDDVYALNFGNSLQKRIAYAPSGILVENEENKEIYKILGKCVDRFDIVTVREKESIEILEKYTKQKIEDVVDPTLLLSQEDWDQVASDIDINEDYIFCYFLGRIRMHKMLLKRIMKKYSVKKICFITSGDYEDEDRWNPGNYFYPIKDAGPAEFVSWIKGAKAVCTDSFHGMALSIVYQKQFYVVKRGSSNMHIVANLLRQKNLLRKVGIGEERIVTCVRELETIDPIDYEGIRSSQYWQDFVRETILERI